MNKACVKLCVAAGAIIMASSSISAQSLKLTKDNIDQIVKAMTLEEKAKIVVGQTNPLFVDGVYMGGAGEMLPGGAGATQNIDRLGIPNTIMTDGPSGMHLNQTRKNDPNTYYATGFPVGTLLACSWNTDVVYKVGQALGEEVLEYGSDLILGPGMNIHRNPLCGRNFEYFSEDPVISGNIAAAYVNGVQSNGVGATIKHFAANNQETNRTFNDARISTRALREIYLKGFEIAVKKSQPWAVMASYNKLNGVFTQQNPELLTSLLRDEWGFKGIVMTDWGVKDGTVNAVMAGNDLMEPGSSIESERIINAVRDGSLSIEDLDRNVRHMLEFIVKTPRFNSYSFSNKPDLKAHALVSREGATEGMVLLKNDNDILPLGSGTSIDLYGINSYDLLANGTGSGDVNKAYEVSLCEGLENAGYSINRDLKDLYGKYHDFELAYITSENGALNLIGKPKLEELALYTTTVQRFAQRGSDTAVLTIGRNAGEEGDRNIVDDFNLTARERALLESICNFYHANGKKVVVVLNVGGVVETASWKDLPDAILLGWQPGQEGGNAMADIISGNVTPSGKLAMTFPVSCIDVPSTKNFPVFDELAPAMGEFPSREKKNVDYTNYEEGIYVGYRYFTTSLKNVSYPFGYGLSYTEFSYSSAKVKTLEDGFEVSINVANEGKVAGKEVVQLYVSAPESALDKPTRELKAFAKTKVLAPGESQEIVLKVSNYDLCSYDEQSYSWFAGKGNYGIMIGKDCNTPVARLTYTLKKDYTSETLDLFKDRSL